MAYMVMAYMVMAYLVSHSHGQCSYGLYGYGLYSYGVQQGGKHGLPGAPNVLARDVHAERGNSVLRCERLYRPQLYRATTI